MFLLSEFCPPQVFEHYPGVSTNQLHRKVAVPSKHQTMARPFEQNEVGPIKTLRKLGELETTQTAGVTK